jgi:hypothetical protein
MEEARGKRPEQEAGAALASAYIYIGGLRTKIWAGVVPPASGTPTQLAESVDPTEGHSLRPHRLQRCGCGAQRGDGGSRADIRYGTLRRQRIRWQASGIRAHVARSILLHSTSSPRTLGLIPGGTTVWLQCGWLGASGTQYLSALGRWQSSWQWRAQPWSRAAHGCSALRQKRTSLAAALLSQNLAAVTEDVTRAGRARAPWKPWHSPCWRSAP